MAPSPLKVWATVPVPKRRQMGGSAHCYTNGSAATERKALGQTVKAGGGIQIALRVHRFQNTFKKKMK